MFLFRAAMFNLLEIRRNKCQIPTLKRNETISDHCLNSASINTNQKVNFGWLPGFIIQIVLKIYNFLTYVEIGLFFEWYLHVDRKEHVNYTII